MELFINREEAGKLLADKLMKYAGKETVVLAIPRGGVPIGYEIANKLNAPLDVIMVKKIGHPANREFAIGAVSLDSHFVDEAIEIDKEYINKEVIDVRESLLNKYRLYMGNRHLVPIKNKTAIVVDDGIATGNTLLASIKMLKKRFPAKIIVAAPVVPFENIEMIKNAADDFIYNDAPKYFPGVGSFYEVFNQVSDDEVVSILNKATLNMKKKITM